MNLGDFMNRHTFYWYELVLIIKNISVIKLQIIKTIFLNQGADYTIGIVITIILVPAIIVGTVGAILWAKKKRRSANILFIIAGSYVLVVLGIGGSMLL